LETEELVALLAVKPTQPHIQWIPEDPFPRGIARPGHDADH
jgi:hypothetical protein